MPTASVSKAVLALDARRRAMGLSLREVARRGGYAPRAVEQWVAGIHDPGIRALEDCLAAIGCEIAVRRRRQRKAPDPRMTAALRRLVELVAVETGIAVAELRSRSRYRNIVDARRLVCRIARESLSATATAIGDALGGRDPTTILSAARPIADGLRRRLQDDAVARVSARLQVWLADSAEREVA